MKQLEVKPVKLKKTYYEKKGNSCAALLIKFSKYLPTLRNKLGRYLE